MTQAELRARTKQFALRCLTLADALPQTASGKSIRMQLARSGTSVGANYRAACRSRSRKEFVAKLAIVLEEADETCFWLELIIESKAKSRKSVEPLLVEANELTAIFVSTLKSTKAKTSLNKSEI